VDLTQLASKAGTTLQVGSTSLVQDALRALEGLVWENLGSVIWFWSLITERAGTWAIPMAKCPMSQ
jgi:hypothetical protein